MLGTEAASFSLLSVGTVTVFVSFAILVSSVGTLTAFAPFLGAGAFLAF